MIFSGSQSEVISKRSNLICLHIKNAVLGSATSRMLKEGVSFEIWIASSISKFCTVRAWSISQSILHSPCLHFTRSRMSTLPEHPCKWLPTMIVQLACSEQRFCKCLCLCNIYGASHPEKSDSVNQIRFMFHRNRTFQRRQIVRRF